MRRGAAEARLIEGFLKGEREAFATVDAWISAVLALPGWHASIQSSADDIKQQVLMALTENLRRGKYQGKGLKTYVSRMVRYTCLKVYDAHHHHQPIHEDFKSDNPTPAEELAANERWSILKKVIARLQYRCRRILVLRYYKKLDHNKIADALGISGGASRQWLRRCLDTARNLVKRYENV